MKVRNMFSGDWTFTRHYAIHEGRGYRLWIGVSPGFMQDEGRERLLAGLTWWEKRKVWKELRREMHQRSVARIEELAEEERG